MSSVNVPRPVMKRASSMRRTGLPRIRSTGMTVAIGVLPSAPAGGDARRAATGLGLGGELPRRGLHRLHDVVVPGAATEVALQPEADGALVGMGMGSEEIGGSQDHPRGAEPALQPVLLPESFLEGMELSVAGQ